LGLLLLLLSLLAHNRRALRSSRRICGGGDGIYNVRAHLVSFYLKGEKYALRLSTSEN
jgi:hypothetical protein